MALRSRPAPADHAAPDMAHQASTFQVPPSPIRRSRLPEIAVGLLIIGLSALIFVWLVGGTNQTRPVVAALTDIDRGEIIEASHLVQVDIETSTDVNALAWSSAGDLVGTTAAIPFRQGSLVTMDAVLVGSPVPPGFDEVGVVLEPGPIPSTSLSPGDRVNIIDIPQSGDPRIITADVEVLSLRRAGDLFFVSLLVPDVIAPEVAASAHRGQIRLTRTD